MTVKNYFIMVMENTTQKPMSRCNHCSEKKEKKKNMTDVDKKDDVDYPPFVNGGYYPGDGSYFGYK